jgi:hypothetical protein
MVRLAVVGIGAQNEIESFHGGGSVSETRFAPCQQQLRFLALLRLQLLLQNALHLRQRRFVVGELDVGASLCEKIGRFARPNGKGHDRGVQRSREERHQSQ